MVLLNNMIYASILLCLCFANVILCANILMISLLPSVSHSLWNQKLANLIVTETNHKVTILDINHEMIKHPKINHVELKMPSILENLDLAHFSQQGTTISVLNQAIDWLKESCTKVLKLPSAKQFLDKYKGKKPFDLIIFDGGCCESFLGFVEMFGSPPLIMATAYGSASFLMEYAGIYDNPSYVPASLSPLTSDMSFMERVENTLFYLYTYYGYNYINMNQQNELAKEFFGNEISNVRDIASRAVVTLLNYHPTMDGVKPFPPSVVTIGGFHIEPPKQLEKELKIFLDNSKNGVIYFSFGSNLQCTDMDESKFNIFLQVFKEIKENIVWKCGKSVPNLPKNVYFGKWFNQSDILAHPNVKAFISHGGLLGTQEAVYNGVPIMVFPFIVDQHFTAKRLEKMGVAIPMNYMNLTVDGLKTNLQRLLTDSSFQEKMKARSVAFRDNPISPRNLTLFWIEYVLRHPETDLLRLATQKMSVFQILLLDVIIFLLSIVLTVIITLIYLTRKVLSICKKSKTKKKTS